MFILCPCVNLVQWSYAWDWLRSWQMLGRVRSRKNQSTFWTIAFNRYDIELSIRSRSNRIVIVHTQLPGRMHMICVISFPLLITRHLDIVRYFIFAFVYCETSGRSLKQKGVYATSCSCTHPMWLILVDTCVQVIRFTIWLTVLIMVYDVVLDMMICYFMIFISTCVID